LGESGFQEEGGLKKIREDIALQIVGALKQAEAGMKVTEVCRQTGVSQFNRYPYRQSDFAIFC